MRRRHLRQKEHLSDITKKTNKSNFKRQQTKSFVVIAVGLTVTFFLCCVYYKFNVPVEQKVDDNDNDTKQKISKTCLVTIGAWNQFGFVRNLYTSTIINNNNDDGTKGIDCFVWVLSDRSELDASTTSSSKKAVEAINDAQTFIQSAEHFTMVTMKEIVQNPFKLAFMYNASELVTVLKPFAFDYIFEVINADAAIYLDCDIWVVDSSALTDILRDKLTSRSAVMTTANNTSYRYLNIFNNDNVECHRLSILSSGQNNLGVFGLRKNSSSRKFLQWWQDRVKSYNYVTRIPEPPPPQTFGFLFRKKKASNAYHEMSNWGFYLRNHFGDDLEVLRDKRFVDFDNFPTNLFLREDKETKKQLPYLSRLWGLLSSEKVVLMHFSQILPADNVASLRLPSNKKRTMNAYKQLFQLDYKNYFQIPYGFDRFSNGVSIEYWMRNLYASAMIPVADRVFLHAREIETEQNFPYKQYFIPYFRQACKKEMSALDPFSDVTVLKWLWNTTPRTVVDMHGKFYFSAMEDFVYLNSKELQRQFPDPRANPNFYEMKQWFSSQEPVRQGMISQGIWDQWNATWNYHQNNHDQFHRTAAAIQGRGGTSVGINVIGWIGGMFGVGISSLKLVEAAQIANISINAIEIALSNNELFVHPRDLHFLNTTKRSLSEMVNLVVLNSDMTFRFISDTPSIIRENKYNIGFWAWELDIVPMAMMENLPVYDEIWCPSSFIRDALLNSPGYDGTPVKVLPIPLILSKKDINKNINNAATEPPLPPFLQQLSSENLRSGSNNISDNGNKPFVFLIAFAFHSLMERKNPDAAIRAFLDAFPSDQNENVRLIVKSNNVVNMDIQFRKLMEVAKGDPRITFVYWHLSDQDNEALHLYQDCYISLHRSEGYGMNILETLGNGIPVIATNYSGNVDFFAPIRELQGICNFPVPYELIEIKRTIGPFKKGNHWAEPDHQYTVHAMRTVVQNNCKTLYANQTSKLILANYGHQAVGEMMKRHLDDSLDAILRKQK